ncbi:MAG: hypothetical protein IPK03_02625 [Bacteroidetes bacterium]|nr:hypothetical protein [Bacteroidota bacterium]
MKTIYLLFSFTFFATLFVGCSKQGDTSDVEVKFIPYFGNQELKLDSFYVLKSGDSIYQFRADVLKLFISNLQVVNEANVATKIADLNLYNLRAILPATALTIKTTLPIGHYQSIAFNFGLNDSLNNLMPNTFSSEHPMSTQQGMYWPMQKYRFMVFEGFVYDKNKVELNSIAYHTGVNSYREIMQTLHFHVEKDQTTNIQIKIDFEKIFTQPGNAIDPTKEVFSHSTSASQLDLNTKIMDNLVKGVSASFN